MERVVEGIKTIDSQLHVNTVAESGRELLNFLESARVALSPPGGPYIEGDVLDKLIDLRDAREALARIERSSAIDPWFSAPKRLKRGSVHEATIQNVVEYGYFCEAEVVS